MFKQGVAAIALLIVGMVAGAAFTATAQTNDVFQGWRPLLRNEVCPQQPNGHVEIFVDDAQGRHWIRPQQDGHDIPCGLARPI